MANDKELFGEHGAVIQSPKYIEALGKLKNTILEAIPEDKRNDNVNRLLNAVNTAMTNAQQRLDDIQTKLAAPQQELENENKQEAPQNENVNEAVPPQEGAPVIDEAAELENMQSFADKFEGSQYDKDDNVHEDISRLWNQMYSIAGNSQNLTFAECKKQYGQTALELSAALNAVPEDKRSDEMKTAINRINDYIITNGLAANKDMENAQQQANAPAVDEKQLRNKMRSLAGNVADAQKLNDDGDYDQELCNIATDMDNIANADEPIDKTKNDFDLKLIQAHERLKTFVNKTAAQTGAVKNITEYIKAYGLDENAVKEAFQQEAPEKAQPAAPENETKEQTLLRQLREQQRLMLDKGNRLNPYTWGHTDTEEFTRLKNDLDDTIKLMEANPQLPLENVDIQEQLLKLNKSSLNYSSIKRENAKKDGFDNFMPTSKMGENRYNASNNIADLIAGNVDRNALINNYKEFEDEKLVRMMKKEYDKDKNADLSKYVARSLAVDMIAEAAAKKNDVPVKDFFSEKTVRTYTDTLARTQTISELTANKTAGNVYIDMAQNKGFADFKFKVAADYKQGRMAPDPNAKKDLVKDNDIIKNGPQRNNVKY